MMEAEGEEEYEEFIITAIEFFLFFLFYLLLLHHSFLSEKKICKISCTCNAFKLFFYIFFNFRKGIILGFPFIAVNDYEIYFIELIKKEEKDKYASKKEFIKIMLIIYI